jgi:hypothetical protein
VLEEEVAGVRRRRKRLHEAREKLEESRRSMTDRLEGLENFILSSLGEGKPGGSSIQVCKNQVGVLTPPCFSPLAS